MFSNPANHAPHLNHRNGPLPTVARMFKMPLYVWGLMVLFAFLTSCCLSTSQPDAVATEATAQEAPTVIPSTPTINAVFLPFQHGFMVYIEGTSCLYAYADDIIIPRAISEQESGNYHYCLPFADMPETPEAAPPDPFGRVWHHYDEVSDALGAPTGDPIRYVVTSFPPPDPVVMGGIFYEGILTLPDGTMLYCGMRAATAGTCQLRAP